MFGAPISAATARGRREIEGRQEARPGRNDRDAGHAGVDGSSRHAGRRGCGSAARAAAAGIAGSRSFGERCRSAPTARRRSRPRCAGLRQPVPSVPDSAVGQRRLAGQAARLAAAGRCRPRRRSTSVRDRVARTGSVAAELPSKRRRPRLVRQMRRAADRGQQNAQRIDGGIACRRCQKAPGRAGPGPAPAAWHGRDEARRPLAERVALRRPHAAGGRSSGRSARHRRAEAPRGRAAARSVGRHWSDRRSSRCPRWRRNVAQIVAPHRRAAAARSRSRRRTAWPAPCRPARARRRARWRISTVSAWSSAVWPVTIRSVPGSRGGLAPAGR